MHKVPLCQRVCQPCMPLWIEDDSLGFLGPGYRLTSLSRRRGEKFRLSGRVGLLGGSEEISDIGIGGGRKF